MNRGQGDNNRVPFSGSSRVTKSEKNRKKRLRVGGGVMAHVRGPLTKPGHSSVLDFPPGRTTPSYHSPRRTTVREKGQKRVWDEGTETKKSYGAYLSSEQYHAFENNK